METVRTRIDSGGRVVIPAEFRRCLDLKPGDAVFLTLHEGSIEVESWLARVRKAQEMVAKYIPPGGPSLVDEFIAERPYVTGT